MLFLILIFFFSTILEIIIAKIHVQFPTDSIAVDFHNLILGFKVSFPKDLSFAQFSLNASEEKKLGIICKSRI